MIRLILMTDFTETYAYRLLKGIMEYAKLSVPFVICRMPTAYKDKFGIDGVINWAKRWNANAIIAQFEPNDDVAKFAQNNIIAIAQDYKKPFKSIPNIISNYQATGCKVAKFYVDKGFKSFAFFGYNNCMWSSQRGLGFKQYLKDNGYLTINNSNFYEFQQQNLDNLWSYDSEVLTQWLLSLPKGTALFACDDTQGNRISELCTAIGIKVPEDIAIMGVDNDEILCNLSSPTLSSVNLNVQLGGFEVAQMIYNLLNKTIQTGYDIYIQSGMIVQRQSTDIFFTTDALVAMAIGFIHQNIIKNIGVEDVVKQVPLSRRLLEIRFKKATNTSIYKYIYNLRMEKFAHILLTKNDSIEHLAIEAGIKDYSNLSRQFKKHYGKTPSEYKKHPPSL